MKADETSTGGRARSRRGDGARLRDEILDATENILAAVGNENGVSIRAVAERVGVTPPSIYRHFADKDELLFAVSERQFGTMDAVMDAAAATTDDPREALLRRGEAYVQYGVEHPESYRIMFMNRVEPDDEVRLRRIAKCGSFDRLMEVATAAVAAGITSDTDPAILAMRMWIIAHGVTSLFIAQPGFQWGDQTALVRALFAPLLSTSHVAADRDK